MPSLEEKVDILLKRVVYGKSISGPYDSVFPNQETIATSPKVRGTDIRLADVPTTPPGSSDSDISVYQGPGVIQDEAPEGALRMTIKTDSESIQTALGTLRRTWQAKLDDEFLGSWIDPTYGANYEVKVFVGPISNPIFDGANPNCDQIFSAYNAWYFDYDSGTLYIFDDSTEDFFADIWSSTKTIYIKGYRYTSSSTFNSMSYQDSTNVNITGGSVVNLTDFSLTNGSGNGYLISIDSNNGDLLNLTNVNANTIDVTGDMTIGGDLIVTGNIQQQTGTQVEFADTILDLNVPATDVVISTGLSGIQVYRGLVTAGGALKPEAQLVWDYATDRWNAGIENSLSAILVQSDLADATDLYGPNTAVRVATSDLFKEYYSLNNALNSVTAGNTSAVQQRFAKTAYASIQLGSSVTIGDDYTIQHNLNTENVMVFGYKLNNGARSPFIPSYSVVDVDNISIKTPTNEQNDTYYFVILG